MHIHTSQILARFFGTRSSSEVRSSGKVRCSNVVSCAVASSSSSSTTAIPLRRSHNVQCCCCGNKLCHGRVVVCCSTCKQCNNAVCLTFARLTLTVRRGKASHNTNTTPPPPVAQFAQSASGVRYPSSLLCTHFCTKGLH